MTFDSEKRYEKEDIASWPPGHRRCRECHEVLPFERFHKHKDCLYGINTVCKECRKPRSQKNYQGTAQEFRMWNSAKGRAKKFGIPFTITVDDIVIPELCPVLGIPLIPSAGRASDNSPSLDQITPRGGYILGNIVVMSWKANRIKNNFTSMELKSVAKWMDNNLGIFILDKTMLGHGYLG